MTTTIRQLPAQLGTQRNLFERNNPGHGDLYHSLPASPMGRFRDSGHMNANAAGPMNSQLLQPPPPPTRRGNSSQAVLPQNYAYPLQRHNTYPNHTLHRENERSAPSDEHFLRRKTPSGVVAGAYDGTSVEQIERPHAMKHILLPVTSSPPSGMMNMSLQGGMPTELPLRTPGVAPRNGGPGQYQSRDQPEVWRDPTGRSVIDPNLSMQMSMPMAFDQRGGPQIDSVLNQPIHQNLPLHHPSYAPQNWGVMPPSFQNALSPTTLNDQGSAHPSFWQNVYSMPFRPAAMRDNRYPASPAWMQQQQQYGTLGPLVPDWQHGLNASYPLPLYSPTPNLPNFPGQHPPEPTPSYPPHNPNHVYPVHGLNQFNHATVPTDFGLSSGDASHGVSSSGQTTPRGPPTPSMRSLETTPSTEKAQMRERVFAQAHTVYIELLKFLHQTRKQNDSGKRSNARPAIYPKPPRQPGVDFSSSNGRPPHSRSRSTCSFPADPNHHRPDQADPLSLHRHNTPNWLPEVASTHNWRADLRQRRPSQQTPPQSLWGPQGFSPSYSQVTQFRDQMRSLRRMSGTSVSQLDRNLRENHYHQLARQCLERLCHHCETSSWQWIEGLLLAGCLAYALGDYQHALKLYSNILELDPNHVEAIGNLAATFLAMQDKRQAESYWIRAVKLRPSYFEAVEHLIGLLCNEHRGKDAVAVIDFVERSLQLKRRADSSAPSETRSEISTLTKSPCLSETSDKPVFEYDGDTDVNFTDPNAMSNEPGFGTSGYAIPGADNGRMLQLIHAKGNMLYAMGDNVGAARAFETAVLIGAGRRMKTINGLISHIIGVLANGFPDLVNFQQQKLSSDPILLPPEKALWTHKLCFPTDGQLPGLADLSSDGVSKKAAISTTSNSLLSLAKIFQDGMASNSMKNGGYQSSFSVRDILALYYLSLALQPSPSTANNVGILLAGVQQAVPNPQLTSQSPSVLPGVVPGSGVALALQYYNYGLNLDQRHAHLYTNLGSLLKDIGQLEAAVKMYEQAVKCDGNFDIALANLANAVKDQGRIADAITFYKRAVTASPDFAEAVCGLANALNSVCNWAGRGGVAENGGKRDRWHVNDHGMLVDATQPGVMSSGWMKRVVDLVEKQLTEGEYWGKGSISESLLAQLYRVLAVGSSSSHHLKEKEEHMKRTLSKWAGHRWEGARLLRLIERAVRRLVWQWYQDRFVRKKSRPVSTYTRPTLPSSLTIPAAPTVLPFHTFTCPMSAKQIRLISQRNGLRISCSTLKAPWLPTTVFPPPAPPNPYLKIGYVSSDFNNHPLAHLMQSVFGMHDPKRVKAYCYATTTSDKSVHRQQIEREAPVMYDASSWSAEKLVNQIVEDGIHILVNLNGYTRGARNEIFAARPAPIQMSFMGFAGTLGAEWCDYLLADETAVPPDTLRPYRRNVDFEDQLADDSFGGEQEDWVYSENIIYCRDTFFCCDHRQSAPDAHGAQLDWESEQQRRWKMRKEIFPNLADDVLILGNFNQLYKIEPTTFRTWLRILSRIPNSILWLLRFPDLGETHLRHTAHQWASPEVASRIIFTDVAPKHQHIARARVCDLFLDTPECNAHTTAADVLWSGTPLLTLGRYKYKMCSRMAGSILKGALPKTEEGRKAASLLIANNEDEYENLAVKLALGTRYDQHRVVGRLGQLRKLLYESRMTSALFDTRRWVSDLEDACWIAWERWVKGEGGDIWLAKEGRRG